MTSSIIPREGNLTVILSAELDYLADEVNADRHADLRERLAYQLGIGELHSVQVCEGAYKGVPERSIAISGPVSRTMAIGQHHAELFGQESWLAIDHYGQGRLHFTESGDLESVGHYSALHGAADAWTRVKATGEAFTFI